VRQIFEWRTRSHTPETRAKFLLTGFLRCALAARTLSSIHAELSITVALLAVKPGENFLAAAGS
jgi:hypothetical protein